MDEYKIILEELRDIIALSSNQKDNVLLDLLDKLTEALSNLTSTTNVLSTDIKLKQQPIVINNKLDEVKSLIDILSILISDINLKIKTTDYTDVLTKIDNNLLTISKINNSKELLAIESAIKNSSLKDELKSINTSLNKLNSWSFDIIRDNNGNMKTIIAKQNK
jgi:hypothetical protein